MSVRPITSASRFLSVTPEKFFNVLPNLAVWGVATGVALSLFGSDVPLVKKDILSNIPIVGGQWDVEAPAQDNSST